MYRKPKVFISSTCYDLTDLRFELQKYLEERGFLVKASDNIDSDFKVNAKVNSIESCLQNVGKSDVIVCIVDKRYGPPLKKYDDLSATHLEIRKARKMKKNVLFFFRNKSWDEFCRLNRTSKKGKAFESQYIEPISDDRRKRLVDFINEIRPPEDSNNWMDPFESSYDLKPKVYRRLQDVFPENRYALAMTPGRFLYVNCIVTSNQPYDSFYVSWESSTVAIKARCGFRINQEVTVTQQICNIIDKELPMKCHYDCAQFSGSKNIGIWCEYSNSFGDRFRTERQIQLTSSANFANPGILTKLNGQQASDLRSTKIVREQLFVLDDKSWIKMMDSKEDGEQVPAPIIDFESH